MYAMCIIDAAFDVAELVDLSPDHDREPSHGSVTADTVCDHRFGLKQYCCFV